MPNTARSEGESAARSYTEGFPGLGAAVDAAWTRQLVLAWRNLNATHFKDALRLPSLLLADSEAKLGEWNPNTRSIAISRRLCLEHPWGVVVEVLKHEMAHQYVAEALQIRDESAHGVTFRSVCEKLGIDARGRGVPEHGATGDDSRNRIIQKVGKLLALAESQNQHEAEAAMAAAQRLMLQHNLDAASASLGYSFKHLGAVKARTFEPDRLIANVLASHFFVEAIWVPSYDALQDRAGRVLEICGAPENLAMAEYVHGFLHHTCDRLWRAYKRDRGARSSRERTAYQAGVVEGFAETLRAQSKVNAEAGLVWVGDVDLRRYHRRRHPHVRTTRYLVTDGASRSHGRSDGRQVVLHKPLHQPDSASGAPKALGPRRA